MILSSLLVWARNASCDPLLAMGLENGFTNANGFANTQLIRQVGCKNEVPLQALPIRWPTEVPNFRESICICEYICLTLCKHKVRLGRF
ncbi:hypothetical protein B0T09DRAFT_325714 [Sordaria sp. MPI-SDFR-AT-0083]|nr:hypothetical protein B0T09DRAFT_325714 [Sordaria sp. MPI-SDFR-AT-0083]